MYSAGIGPQPHPGYIEVFCDVALDDGKGTVERAGEDAEGVDDQFCRDAR